MAVSADGVPDGEVLAQGAEGRIIAGKWWDGRDVVYKVRDPKSYRHPELDRSLRTARVRMESRLMQRARSAGVRTPVVYEVWPESAVMVMERVKGVPLMRALERADAATRRRLLVWAGEAVGRLHGAGLVHGDLTLLNIFVPDDAKTDADRILLLDFGLGDQSCGAEVQAVDVHVLMESLESLGLDTQGDFGAAMEGYAASFKGASAVARQLEDIKSRGRYT